MKTSPKNVGVAAIVVGLYGLTPLWWHSQIAAIGAIVIGIVLLIK